MILVDTSVWIDHLRHGDAALAASLEAGQVAIHPFVVGELACGNLRDRAEVLGLLQSLPTLVVASDKEVLFSIEAHALAGLGIGYVDVHLLTSAKLSGATLWTRDKRLLTVAAGLGLAQPEARR